MIPALITSNQIEAARKVIVRGNEEKDARSR